jgi:hypothetical protein
VQTLTAVSDGKKTGLSLPHTEEDFYCEKQAPAWREDMMTREQKTVIFLEESYTAVIAGVILSKLAPQ